jgi:hypothetical protein
VDCARPWSGVTVMAVEMKAPSRAESENFRSL